MTKLRPAIFFDRDGVLTEPVWNPNTDAYESAHRVENLRLCPAVIEPVRKLGEWGFELFIVSNQPSYAKGKTTLENIRAIARSVEDQFLEGGVSFREMYYCYHHPRGIVPEYTGRCACRKPEPHFLLAAAERHGVDLGRSWMLGDRDTDIECGRRAGCRTILIRHPQAVTHQGASRPDHVARDVTEAAAIIARDAPILTGAALKGTP